MLAEEANEIGLAVNKAIRHGLDSYHPDTLRSVLAGDMPDHLNNRYDIAKECGDLNGVLDRLSQLNILDYEVIRGSQSTKMKRAAPYVHHQTTDWGYQRQEDD